MTSVPDDPEDWTDEQWLAWLAEGDVTDAGGTPPEPPAPRRPSRTESLGAKMLAASMRGMAEAIYGPKDEPAIVIDASGDPPDDEGLDVRLDPDHPAHSVVVVRPWLLRHLHDDRADPPHPSSADRLVLVAVVPVLVAAAVPAVPCARGDRGSHHRGRGRGRRWVGRRRRS